MSDGRQLPWARSEVVRRLRLSPFITERLYMLICCIVSDFSEVPARHTELDSAEKLEQLIKLNARPIVALGPVFRDIDMERSKILATLGRKKGKE
jgi:hypothetical protein